MGTTHELCNRLVVIRPYRKFGNGAIGSDRKGKSGKRGSVYQMVDGKEPELLAAADGPTGAAVAKKLRKMAGIPSYVTINNNGETSY